MRQESLPAAVIIYMFGRILTDLETKIRNPWKRSKLAGIRELFQQLEDFADSEKANFVAYDEGKKMLQMLDRLLER